MNNDLISRSALEKEIFGPGSYDTYEELLDAVRKAIDNAPTVNPYFPLSEEVFCKITDAEWEHSDSFWITTPSGKKIEFEKKRPQQGEWIDYDNTFYKCPECGYLLEKDCPRCQNKVILPKGGAE